MRDLLVEKREEVSMLIKIVYSQIQQVFDNYNESARIIKDIR